MNLKNLIFSILLNVVISPIYSQNSCVEYFSVTPGLYQANYESEPIFTFTWDFSEAIVYNSNLSFKIQTIQSPNCDFVENLGVQNYTFTNFSINNSNIMYLNLNTTGSRCFKWRFVIQSVNSSGNVCTTITPWKNYNINDYPY